MARDLDFERRMRELEDATSIDKQLGRRPPHMPETFDAPLSIRDEIARNHAALRAPAGPKTVLESDAVAAIRAEREQAQRTILEQGITLNERLFTNNEFNAVTNGTKTPQAAVEAILSTGNRAGAHQLLEALAEDPEHQHDAAALTEALAWHSANAHLSLEQAKAAAAAEDERLAREASAERFVKLQEAQPALAERMAAIDTAHAEAGIESDPQTVLNLARVDAVAEANARFKERVHNSTPSMFGREERYFATPANIEREHRRQIVGDPNLSESELAQMREEGNMGDAAPRARVVKIDPALNDAYEKLRIVVAGTVPRDAATQDSFDRAAVAARDARAGEVTKPHVGRVGPR